MLRRLPPSVFRRARWARVRRSRSGSRHQPSGIASASRFSAATRSSAGRSGLDHRPSMYASPAPTSPPEQHPHDGRAVSWMRISPASLATGSPKSCARPVRQHDGQPADADPSRGAEHDPPRGVLDQAPERQLGPADVGLRAHWMLSRARSAASLTGAEPPRRGGGTGRRAATAGARASGSVAIVACVSERMAHAASAAGSGRSAARAAARGSCSAAARPSWRSAIAIRRPSASSRTWTA